LIIGLYLKIQIVFFEPVLTPAIRQIYRGQIVLNYLK